MMNRIRLLVFTLLFSSLYADTVYIVGGDDVGAAAYWTITTPGTPSSTQLLDTGGFEEAESAGVAISPSQQVFITGSATDDGDDYVPNYWTVSPSGVASSLNQIGDPDSGAEAIGVAFNPLGGGSIVGVDGDGNAARWPISSSGVVGSSIALDAGGYAYGVAYASSGIGYIAGLDNMTNACYWLITDMGINGPYTLVGGESGGSSSAYGVAVTPEDVAYIVGSTTSGEACYWTVTPDNVASSAINLGTGGNSYGHDVAFLPSGEGIFVGQGGGNVPIYWPVAADGTVGSYQALSMGSGGGSIANAVAFSSDERAYIVGLDPSGNATLWTLSLSGGPVETTILAVGTANSIAIYFATGPNPPTGLSGRYQTNDFGLVYENCALLQWARSDSSGVVAYYIYKNGVKIGSVDGSTIQYENHDQNKSRSALYAVTAVNDLGQESEPNTVVLN